MYIDSFSLIYCGNIDWFVMISYAIFTRLRKICRSSRQALLLRSHQLSLGRWHLKSLIITASILLALIYYVYSTDPRPGLKTKKRDLVVHAAKPYKSPYSRRRHAKQYDKVGIPLKASRSINLVQMKKSDGKQQNNTKPVSAHLQRQNDLKVIPNNVLQLPEKYKSISKSKTRENLHPLSQINSVKAPNLDIFKGNRKTEIKQNIQRTPGSSVKGLTDNRVVGQKGSKSIISGDDFWHQLSENSLQKSLKFISTGFIDTVKHVTPNHKIEKTVEVTNKVLSKQAVKAVRNTH